MQLMIDRQIQRLEFSMKVIEDALETLTEEERELVKLKYIENQFTHPGLSLEMSVSYPALILGKRSYGNL